MRPPSFCSLPCLPPLLLPLLLRAGCPLGSFHTAVAHRIVDLLGLAQLPAQTDAQRGFDPADSFLFDLGTRSLDNAFPLGVFALHLLGQLGRGHGLGFGTLGLDGGLDVRLGQ